MSPQLFELLSDKNEDIDYTIESLEFDLESHLKLKELVLDKVASLFLNKKHDVEDIDKEINEIELSLTKLLALRAELNQLIKDNK